MTSFPQCHQLPAAGFGVEFAAVQIIGAGVLERRAPHVILTANIGLPKLLGDLAARLPESAAIVHVDGKLGTYSQHDFFRAPAHLVLPQSSISRVIAAAVVLRPGGKSAELLCTRRYKWPEDADCAIGALERFILAHVDQWRPPRALWPAPAEELLPEVLMVAESG